MIFLAILVLLSALVIAGCAAYFSIVGMTLLFVGSGISIIIMGLALEIGKLVTVSFLHQQWEKLGFLLKMYLILASFILSVITSVGIYGFLAAGYNATNIKVKSYELVIDNNNKAIERLQQEIKTLTTEVSVEKEMTLVNSNKDNFIQQQLKLIAQNEKRLADLLASVEAEKKKSNEEQNLAKQTLEDETKKETEQIKLYNDRLVLLDKEIQTWLEQGTGGLFKANGLDKARSVKQAQENERAQIDTQIKNKQSIIEQLRLNYTIKLKEISENLSSRIKTIESRITLVEQEITKDKQVILEYQDKASNEIKALVVANDSNTLNNKNAAKQKELEIQTLQKGILDAQSKINETDVGTFKFVSKSIGLSLDNTVNWFIWSIMFVFDPLAVTLIICFNHLIKHRVRPSKVLLSNLTTTTTSTPAFAEEQTVANIVDKDNFIKVGPGENKLA